MGNGFFYAKHKILCLVRIENRKLKFNHLFIHKINSERNNIENVCLFALKYQCECQTDKFYSFYYHEIDLNLFFHTVSILKWALIS